MTAGNIWLYDAGFGPCASVVATREPGTGRQERAETAGPGTPIERAA
jgi:hypothetical protein